MRHASFRFYAELNDFLPPSRRGASFGYAFQLPAAAKDLIEAIGIPHTEIDLLLINNRTASFADVVNDGDRIAAFPFFHSLDVSRDSLVQPPPLDSIRFVLDIHLGRLAAYLRMAGFDALYPNDYRDEEIAAISAHEHRVLLTSDRGLLKRSTVTYGYYVRSREPRRQLHEVMRRYELLDRTAPFTRCLECNAQLIPAAKQEVWELLPPKTRELHTHFLSCSQCGRVFWKGSHYERMQKLLDSVAR